MFNETVVIGRLEASNTNELAQLILRASAEEEKALRIYLGNERFRRLRDLALRREMTLEDRRDTMRANVVLIPGLLGCELASTDRQQNQERIWLSPGHIVAGHLERLQLDARGLTEANPDYTIRVTGIMKRYYGELMLALAEHYNVQAFWYDWRKDLRLAAAQLQARIDNWFPPGEPVHLVAHAAGGLVARTYIQQFPERWNLKKDESVNSKLIMIGVPNYGLYTTPQALTGHLGLIQWIDLLDTRHDRADFREIIKTFPSLYQLLPAPHIHEKFNALYDAKTYGAELNLLQTHLTQAKQFHETLRQTVVDPHRMIYIAGHNQPTFVDVDIDKISAFETSRYPDTEAERAYINETYTIGCSGDGTVPHPLGVLRTAEDGYIPAYYTEVLHGDLCSHPKVLMAIQELLAVADVSRQSDVLCGLRALKPELIEEGHTLKGNEPKESPYYDKMLNPRSRSRKTFANLVRRVNSRDERSPTRNLLTVEERDIEERLTFGFLSGDADRAKMSYGIIELKTPNIKINLVSADITDNELQLPSGVQKVDALAMGHYSGSKPYGILHTLDFKISQKLQNNDVSDSDINIYEDTASPKATESSEVGLLITQFTQRGTIRADLAQTFLLVDPRNPERIIVVAGMGEPGRFGAPELTVLVRELCWSLGRMGRKHLATVLIGVGRNNLSVVDAVTSWVRGIKLGITGMTKDDAAVQQACALEEITFFITDPSKVLEFDRVMGQEVQRLHDEERMEVDYVPLNEAEREAYKGKIIEYVNQQIKNQYANPLPVNEEAPTRITVNVEGGEYHFGAITNHASIPKRAIPLDPVLVLNANDELATEADPERQLQLGQFMQRLLIPSDFRNQLNTSTPLIMMLDAKTARIHWELLAQTDPTAVVGETSLQSEPHLQFLGTSRGFTRQLHTMFAPPPEPPPPVQRHLRVLVVADPAADAHLPGAEQEGVAVADLFEQFNIVHAESTTKNRIEVVRLFGPHEATRTTVLRHLMMRTYDVLHFAGHCVYDKKNPAASGWIFSNGERLSAYELTRIDRSPAFVFSNACESGVTPARSDERSVELAPSFAESFFARGVTNFVCTAWPVEDRAARDFALTLYAALLGLDSASDVHRNQSNGKKSRDYSDEQNVRFRSGDLRIVTPMTMHEAMKKARCFIASPPNDVRTWGAYQHYGNPYFRFFDPLGFGQKPKKKAADQATGVHPSEAKTEREQTAIVEQNTVEQNTVHTGMQNGARVELASHEATP